MWGHLRVLFLGKEGVVLSGLRRRRIVAGNARHAGARPSTVERWKTHEGVCGLQGDHRAVSERLQWRCGCVQRRVPTSVAVDNIYWLQSSELEGWWQRIVRNGLAERSKASTKTRWVRVCSVFENETGTRSQSGRPPYRAGSIIRRFGRP